MTAGWSLVSTMHGIPETILPCIAHHLQTDAEQLHIYLDAPNPKVEAALAAHSRCIVTVCDEAYWNTTHGKRPAKIVARQLANLEHARKNATSEWLIHVDSDEFLVHANNTAPVHLSEVLSRTPDTCDWVRISPMERVMPENRVMQTIFDGMFRGATRNREIVRQAYGRAARYLFNGMSGHSHGKVGFRVRTTHEVRLHRLVFPGSVNQKVKIRRSDLPPFEMIEDIRLLHFDGWTPLHWTMKLQRLAQTGDYQKVSPGRRRAIEFIKNADQASTRNGLFGSVQTLTEKGEALLSQEGLIRHQTFDPITQTRLMFPGLDMDFSGRAFDARLLEASRSA